MVEANGSQLKGSGRGPSCPFHFKVVEFFLPLNQFCVGMWAMRSYMKTGINLMLRLIIQNDFQKFLLMREFLMFVSFWISLLSLVFLLCLFWLGWFIGYRFDITYVYWLCGLVNLWNVILQYKIQMTKKYTPLFQNSWCFGSRHKS